jgi:hypothetical protein
MAFTHPENLRAINVSKDALMITIATDLKLAISQDGGQSALWRDLPPGGRNVLWLDAIKESGSLNLFLGTSVGLFFSTGERSSWMPQQGGLPTGQIDNWLRGPKSLMATLPGGMYFSRCAEIAPVDKDARKPRCGLAEVEPE